VCIEQQPLKPESSFLRFNEHVHNISMAYAKKSAVEMFFFFFFDVPSSTLKKHHEILLNISIHKVCKGVNFSRQDTNYRGFN
jgi:hypothetical protein